MTDNAPLVQVDIVSDVVCPWCVIGFRQFERARAEFKHSISTVVRWHPFELNPRMPEEGQNLREHLVQKAGITPAQSDAARKRLTELGASLDFEFCFDDEMRIANTFRAHQLLHWAGEEGLQSELKLALFRAYFTERRDVNDCDVLVDLAGRVGLDGVAARAVLESGARAEAVRAAEQRWLARDIRGVPAFIFNERYSVLGAQDAATFRKVLEKTAALARQA